MWNKLLWSGSNRRNFIFFLGEIKCSPSESPLMEKKNNLKEDHEEAKLTLGDVESQSPAPEVGPATVPLRAAVEERTVSFKLGDVEEVPERQRLPSLDLKEETSVDGTGNGEWDCLARALLGPPGDSVLSVLLGLTRCSAAAQWEPGPAQPSCQQPAGRQWPLPVPYCA